MAGCQKFCNLAVVLGSLKRVEDREAAEVLSSRILFLVAWSAAPHNAWTKCCRYFLSKSVNAIIQIPICHDCCLQVRGQSLLAVGFSRYGTQSFLLQRVLQAALALSRSVGAFFERCGRLPGVGAPLVRVPRQPTIISADNATRRR